MPHEKNDFKIPPGHTPYEEWVRVHKEHPPLESVRLFRGNIAYVFNPHAPEYQALLEQCRQDSHHLEKALRREIQERGCLPVWTRQNHRPAYARGYRRMSFLLRPAFSQSLTPALRNKESRMQNDERQDNFILHFDENHRLENVRFWLSKESGDCSHLKSLMRDAIAAKILEQGDLLGLNYGHWRLFAKTLCDILGSLALKAYAKTLENDQP